MPIKATCACGASFAAKDELAGRTVACPKCKQPLTIPRPQAPAAPAVPHENADLFDGLGLKARDESQGRCPSCSAPMAPNAVICVKCGFNTKLGKRMQTISMSNEAPAATGGGHGGHGGDATGMLMARARAAAEEDAIAERAKTQEGTPVWILGAGLGAAILFGLVMSLIPQHVALKGTGTVLVVANFLLVAFAAVGVFVQVIPKNPAMAIGALVGDVIISAIAIWLIFFISEETMPKGATRFSLMLVGVCTTGIAYTDPEGCAKFAFYLQVAYALRFVGLILLVVASLVVPAAGEPKINRLPDFQSPVAVCVSTKHSYHEAKLCFVPACS
ncbi:hypothetical protein [Anatilimnocola floriformis]|uniref:hypothetical protein n=1 Tax=Anatilimnocola floriformis TaxID=2948575 RepID=UPI0020C55530|nr:hypothetical protein [Anatilimnocola floriformis]